MADILLINPPMYDTIKLGKIDSEPHWSPPLGIAYVASVLAQHGYNVKALDLYYVDFETAKEQIRRELGRIVGVACFSEQRVTALRLIEYIRSLSPEVFIAMGGMHGHYLYEQLLTAYPIDAIVLGEGELTFLELAQRVLSHQSLADTPGLAFKAAHGVAVTKPRKLIEDLDLLPFPRYNDFVGTEYALEKAYQGIKAGGEVIEDTHVAGVMASRGCPYHCTFCSTPSFWQRKWRRRSPANVVDEIEHLSREFGYKIINFHDDNFIVDKDWVVEICQEMIRRRICIAWSCAARADSISDDVAKWMKRAGAFLINIGMESYSEAVLNGVRKNIEAGSVWETCRICHHYEIAVSFYLLIGSKAESDASISETADFVQRAQPHAIGPSIMTIFPGTAVYAEAKRDGFIDDDYWLSDQPCPYDTRFHSRETLFRWYRTIEASCCERPLFGTGPTESAASACARDGVLLW